MNRPGLKAFIRLIFPAAAALVFASCVTPGGITAEEFYSMGMAYIDLGKYAEAEKWLNRARAMDKTKTASEYNLGRIAFETGRYEDALRFFERVITKDPENILALKAAAYTLIKTGDLSKAEAYYDRVLKLIPESADDGFNHALVLYAMEQSERAEAVLLRYEFTLDDNKDAILLLARVQKAQNKPEAVDTYSKWLQANSDPQVQYEYAQVLEQEEFYARALTEYRTVLNSLPMGDASDTSELTRSNIRYTIAKILLLADPESEEGINELSLAVSDGFSDTEVLEALLEDEKIPDTRKDGIRRIIREIFQAQEGVVAEEEGEDAEAFAGEEVPGEEKLEDGVQTEPNAAGEG
jgi:tetratricopeptide (TPR) repeat protein